MIDKLHAKNQQKQVNCLTPINLFFYEKNGNN